MTQNVLQDSDSEYFSSNYSSDSLEYSDSDNNNKTNPENIPLPDIPNPDNSFDEEESVSYELKFSLPNFSTQNSIVSDTIHIDKFDFCISTDLSFREYDEECVEIVVECPNLTSSFYTNISVVIENPKIGVSFKKDKFCRLTAQTKKALIPTDLLIKDCTADSGYLENDSLNVTVIIQNISFEDSNSHFKNIYESPAATATTKEETGFVGLKNQGATCYMNSVLQSLFHLPAFRRLVYAIPTTGTEDEEKSIPLNLQRLFARLQISRRACSTKSLTKSFGWGDAETIMQHDVQEFLRVLIDTLETKMKGTPLEGEIAHLFRGRTRSYIRCPKVGYQSNREENFYDLQMVVEGMADLKASFEQYLEKEIMEGENQYQTPNDGKQDAEMAVEFLEFPAVLQIHLRRFQYDFDNDRIVKINDRFEFPEVIDLGPYLAEDSKMARPCEYELFGVLVHSGDPTFGHYYAYLRPSAEEQWFEFNDTTVARATQEEAITENFGGATRENPTYFNAWGTDKHYSGYLLVYVRKTEISSIFEPIKDEDIPAHLQEYARSSDEEEKHKGLKYNDVKVTFITKEDMKRSTALCEPGFMATGDSSITVKHGSKAEELYGRAEEMFGSGVRLWKMNASKVPTSKYPRSGTISEYRLVLFAENEPDHNDGSILIATKFFARGETDPLQFLRTFCLSRDIKTDEVSELICEAAGLPAGTRLKIYMETLLGQAIPIMDGLTLDDLYIRCGAIILAEPDDDGVRPTKIEFLHPAPSEVSMSIKGENAPCKTVVYDEVIPGRDPQNVSQYLSYVHGMTTVEIFDLESHERLLGAIRFPSTASLSEVKAMVAALTEEDFDPERDTMVLFKRDNISHLPSVAEEGASVQSVIRYGLSALYYKVFKGVSSEERKRSAVLRVAYSPDAFKVSFSRWMMIPKGSTPRAIVRRLIDDGCIKEEGPFRAFQSVDSYGTVYGMIDMDDSEIEERYTVRFDKTPSDQISLKDGEKLVTCAHAYADYWGRPKTYGDPFVIKAIQGEPFEETKKRIMEQMGIDAAAFGRLRIVLNIYKGEDVAMRNDSELYAMARKNDDLYLIGQEPGITSHLSEVGVKFYENV